MKRHAIRAVYAAAVSLALCTSSAWAAYPERALRIVVPYTPGGATDTVARIVAKGLGDRLGQPVIVENRPGASGNIGTDQVARSDPDGYSILFATTANAINEGLGMPLRSPILKDFELVSQLVQLQNVLVARADFEAKDVPALLKLAKAKPDTLAYASAGVGTSTHIAGELFKSLADVGLLHVPFKGSAPALLALRSGEVQMMFDNLPSVMPQLRANTVVPLGVSGSTRSPLLPDVPTIAEAGVPGYEIVAWHGLAVPKGTPEAIVQQLWQETQAVLSDPEVSKQLSQIGAEVVKGSRQDFQQRVSGDIDKFTGVVKQAGITLQ